MATDTKEANRLRAARWRANNPEKAKAQRARLRARLRGEDIPYVKPNTTPIEVQREHHKRRMKEWHLKRKAKMAADPEYKEKTLAVRRDYSRRKYRISHGLDSATGASIVPRRHRALPPEEKARRAAVREAEKAERAAARAAAREAEKAKRAAIRLAEREERRKAKVEMQRAIRAAEVEAARQSRERARQAALPKPMTIRPKMRMGRLAAINKWYGF
jgi:hypothetical protein